ncbi:hypothetical protein Sjap_000174 [Stephania japonica]|uniref:Uncharacterized protein n=1 Tax=Stephania japonica TaxID=461633 RepID=A0AAP0PS78_9MAGN
MRQGGSSAVESSSDKNSSNLKRYSRVQQKIRQWKKARVNRTMLPTISKEPKITLRMSHEDQMDSLCKSYKSYQERMRKFDDFFIGLQVGRGILIPRGALPRWGKDSPHFAPRGVEHGAKPCSRWARRGRGLFLHRKEGERHIEEGELHGLEVSK